MRNRPTSCVPSLIAFLYFILKSINRKNKKTCADFSPGSMLFDLQRQEMDVSRMLIKFCSPIVITLLFAFFSTSASAQQLGKYTFDGLLALCPNINNNASGVPANVSFSSYTNTGDACELSNTEFQTSYLNKFPTISLSNYNEFTVTPANGYGINLSSLTFNQYSQIKTIGRWYLRSSIDGFANNIATDTVPVSVQLATVNLNPAIFTNLYSAVTFRLYVSLAQNNNAIWVNDNVTLNGNVGRIPNNPPNPTSNSPQCANPGVTLTRSGSPPGSEIWYWQTSPTGISTAKPEATCTVNTSGTYYLRAYDPATAIWSTGSGSLTVNVTPDVVTPVFSLGASSIRCMGAGSSYLYGISA